MTRRKNRIPSVEWKYYIPVDIAAEVDLLLMDPLRGKAAYGARGELMTALLRRWVSERRLAVAQERVNGDNFPVETSPSTPTSGASS